MRSTLFILLLLTGSTAFCQPDTLWSKLIPGRGNVSGMEAVKTVDGGFAFCSDGWNGDPDHYNLDFYLCKLDSIGEVEWDEFYASTIEDGRFADAAHTLSLFTDGGYFLGGNAGADGMCVRTNSAGEALWIKYLIYEEGYEEIYASTITNNSNILISCAERIALLSDSAEGEVMWFENYIDGNFTFWNKIVRCGEDEYFLGGSTGNMGAGGYDMCAMRINEDGELLWLDTYGSELSEFCRAPVSGLDDSWFLVGTYRFAGGADCTKAMITKIDSEGEEDWQRIYDEYPSGDVLYDAIATPDGGVAACGRDGREDYLLMRLDANGEVLWRQVWDIRGVNECWDIKPMEDGGYFLTGAASNDAWLIRTAPDPANAVWDDFILHPSAFILSPAYPNPFNAQTRFNFALPQAGDVRLAVYDIEGRLVDELFNKQLEAGRYNAVWNGLDCANGLYILRLEAGDNVRVQKLTLVK